MILIRFPAPAWAVLATCVAQAVQQEGEALPGGFVVPQPLRLLADKLHVEPARLAASLAQRGVLARGRDARGYGKAYRRDPE